jgi:hypothetical protein
MDSLAGTRKPSRLLGNAPAFRGIAALYIAFQRGQPHQIGQIAGANQNAISPTK